MPTSPIRKAAIVLASLPEGQASGVLGALPGKQAAAVREEMARLGSANGDEQRAALEEFAAAARTLPAGSPSAATPFQFMHALKASEVLNLLAEEHPQIIALVLSHLPPPQVAAILDALPPDRQASALGRIAALEPPTAEVIGDVEEAIRRRWADAAPSRTRRGMADLVKMLNSMRPAAERRLLGELAQADPGLLRRIRRAIFGADVADCVE